MKSLQAIIAVFTGIFVIALFCSPVQAELSFSGDLEMDISHTDNSTDAGTGVGANAKEDTSAYDQSGRIKVVPTARKEAGNLFFEAKADILAKTDNTDGSGVQVDDAYGKIGTSSFDIQIGRYEGWKLCDESNDMLIAEAPNGKERYEGNYARGRMDGPGQLALHAFSGDVFSFEGGLVYGQAEVDVVDPAAADPTNPIATVQANYLGVRPVVDIKVANFEFAAGVDYLNITPQDDAQKGEITKLGYAATVKAVFGMATLGINYASGTVEQTNTSDVDQPDETTNSYGAYCDLAFGNGGVLTLAGFMTDWEQDNNTYDQTHNQYYIAYAHPLTMIDGTTIKFAVSQATAEDDNPAVGDSDALAFKVRLNHEF